MLIKESDQHKTTFYSHHGLNQFARMPFAPIRNRPSSFTQLVWFETTYIILSSIRFKIVMLYIDDINIFSKTVEKHPDNIETVLSLL